MKFHEYETQKARAIAICNNSEMRRQAARFKKMSPREMLLDKAKRLIAAANSTADVLDKTRAKQRRAPQLKNLATYIYDLGMVAAEIDWFDNNRPFYNVFPIVEKLTNNTRLNVPFVQLSLPQNVLCFRFAKGHEPFGVKTALIRVGAFSENVTAVSRSWYAITEEGNVPLLPDSLFSGLFLTNDADPDNAAFLFSISSPAVMQPFGINVATIDDVISFVSNNDSCSAAENDLYKKRVHFLSRLVVLTALIAEGNDLITPAVLASDQSKYDLETDEAAKRWLEKRAADIQGGGFDFGKKLQEQSETCPHWRNPHMALYWTGPGGVTPVLKLRQGSVVMPKHLGRVPTGFDCPITEHDQTTKAEYVYFLQDPATRLVKIGRTRRSVAARQQESSTFVPNGLKLLGYVETGDCVQLETRIHRELAENRRTNEFFELSRDAVVRVVTAYGGKLAEQPE